jgi:hypothetical protein
MAFSGKISRNEVLVDRDSIGAWADTHFAVNFIAPS